MITVSTLLLIIAFVLFVCAAAGVATRFNLGWAGAACAILAVLAGSLSLA